MTVDDQREVMDQVNYYKEIRTLIQFGDFYRLLSPFEGNETVWMFVSEDKSIYFIIFSYYLKDS